MTYMIAILLAPWLAAQASIIPRSWIVMGAVSPRQAASTRFTALVAPRRLRIILGNIGQGSATALN
jgi:hypothetical protein